MIILDTHIWVWWIHKDKRLTNDHIRLIQENETQGLGVSVISCWEVAKLIELKRLKLLWNLHNCLQVFIMIRQIKSLLLQQEFMTAHY